MTNQTPRAKVITKDEFTDMVISMVKSDEVTYIEATSSLIEELNIDIEDAKSLISRPLLAKLEAEASIMNLLKVKHKTKRFFNPIS